MICTNLKCMIFLRSKLSDGHDGEAVIFAQRKVPELGGVTRRVDCGDLVC